jgi:hypothetical protein
MSDLAERLEAENHALRQELAVMRSRTAWVFCVNERRAMREALERLLAIWSDFTSQEMYGEMLREGLHKEDWDAWSSAHHAARALLREP